LGLFGTGEARNCGGQGYAAGSSRTSHTSVGISTPKGSALPERYILTRTLHLSPGRISLSTMERRNLHRTIYLVQLGGQYGWTIIRKTGGVIRDGPANHWGDVVSSRNPVVLVREIEQPLSDKRGSNLPPRA
jgi:hypothetical protein